MSEKEKKKVHYYEPACSEYVDLYEWRVDEQGRHFVVKVGQKNFDEEIQLYKDACDIKVIVDKLINGDVATIKQLSTPGVYGDVNDYPTDVHPAGYAQALNTLYENQPKEIKDKFPTYEKFASYFANLTEAMIKEMFADKKEEASVNEQ